MALFTGVNPSNSAVSAGRIAIGDDTVEHSRFVAQSQGRAPFRQYPVTNVVPRTVDAIRTQELCRSIAHSH
jgi:hypothetical protein